MKRFLLLLTLLALSVAPAAAQSQSRLWSIYQGGAISGSSQAVALPPQQGLGTVGIQIAGTYTGTIELQCSVDTATYTPVRITATNATTAVTSVSDSAGLWIGSAAGCRAIRAFSTSWSSGTAVVSLYGTSGGGGSGGGGGGAGSTVEIAEGGSTAQVTVTNGGSLQVECTLGCTDTSVGLVDDADFVDGTTAGMPVGGVAESASPTTVTEGDFGWAAITLNRALKTALYNAAGVAAFGTAGTPASPVLTVQGITSMTPLQVQSNATSIASEATLQNVLTSGSFAAAFGTAGAADTQVMSIQGIASMTPVTVGGTVAVSSVSGSVTVATHDIGSITTGVVPGTGATNLAKAEDAAAADGHPGVPVLAVRRDSGGSGVATDGDYAMLSVTSDGSLRVAGSAGTTQYPEDSIHVSADSVVFVGSIRRDGAPSSSAGSAGDYAAINTDANGRLFTNTTLYDESGTALTLAADATHDSTVQASGPQMIGHAHSNISAATAVASGDAVRIAADLLGRVITSGPCDWNARVGGVTTVTNGASTQAIAAGGTGVYLEVWDVTIANTSATAVTVDIRDGTGGAVLYTFPVPANTAGVTHAFSVPVTSSANTAIAVDPSAAASSIIVSMRGCKAK